MKRFGVCLFGMMLLAVFSCGKQAMAEPPRAAVPDPPPPPHRGEDGALVFETPASGVDVAKANDLGFANLALAPEARAAASSCLQGYTIHQVANLNDGQSGNDHSWVSAGEPSWAEIDLGGVYWIYEAALGSDNSGLFADRAPNAFTIQVATEYNADPAAATWTKAYQQEGGDPVQRRRTFQFTPIQARWVRIAITSASSNAVRIDEIEVYGQKEPIPADRITVKELPKPSAPDAAAGPPVDDDLLRYAFLAEEHAWVKTYGRADLDPRLVPYNGRVKEYPKHAGDDVIPLPPLTAAPEPDGVFGEHAWNNASGATVRVAQPDDFARGPLVCHDLRAGTFDGMLWLALRTDRLLSSHVALVSTANKEGCGVVTLTPAGLEFRMYAESDRNKPYKTLPVQGAFNDTLTQFEFCLPLSLFPDHEKWGLRVGLGMGGHHTDAWGQPVLLRCANQSVAGMWLDEARNFHVQFVQTTQATTPVTFHITAPGVNQDITLAPGENRTPSFPSERGPLGPQLDLAVTDDQGGEYSLHLFRYDALERTLTLTEEMIARFERQGMNMAAERAALTQNRVRQDALLKLTPPDPAAERTAFFEARVAKRNLFLRAPDLAPVQELLFVKHHAFEPSHNYSDYFDSAFRAGGGVYRLRLPMDGGRIAPEQGKLTELFASGPGIARNPAADYDLKRVYFSYRLPEDGYYHIMTMQPDGSGLTQITDGPFQDLWPCPLPDGDLAMVSSRCTQRFLCWRPQASVLFRMKPDGSDMRALSYANLTEWAPSVMEDGRIAWTRSEYQDKGADFGHTLWSIRPDGTQPELIFGNDIIQPNGYANGRPVPGTQEYACTLISHFGDLNGPIALVDTGRGRSNPQAITSLTPEVPWPGMWPNRECFREAYPLSKDYFLCAHAPRDIFGLYVIDRFGDRELLYLDRSISSMCPTPFQVRKHPPVVGSPVTEEGDTGEFVVRDVYQGISPPVARGSVKYIRVVEEVSAKLDELPNGEFRKDHPEFQDWYASPVHKVFGPFGWTTYVAKAPHGLAPVEADGSAHFKAPAGKVLYFQALDGNYNELQRMRSVVQLHPGERRGCIGCHESRQSTAANNGRMLAKGPRDLQKAGWEGVPFSYEKIVQPVFDAHCVSCHNDKHKKGLDFRRDLDKDKVPASYRTLVEKGLVNYHDMGWNSGGTEKLPPLSLGSIKSRLCEELNAGHHDVKLTDDETLRIKTWIDLNCPLWPDYKNRLERPAVAFKP